MGRARHILFRARFRNRTARLRALYWGLLRGWDAELCQECGRPVRTVWWCHDDWLWEKVTGEPKPAGSRESAAGIFCITCFDAAASKVCDWIEWAPLNLRMLQTKEEMDVSVAQRHATGARRDG